MAGTLQPLTHDISAGLKPVASLGVLSFMSATSLFLLLSYRIIIWWHRGYKANQVVFLIWNLLLADIQQSMAFLLNVQWLAEDRIHVESPTCFAQGWFVSTGDMASGLWSFAIGVHTFATVILQYRIPNGAFFIFTLMMWIFVYALAVAGVAMHSDLYVRAVAWCWVSAKYGKARLWLHYLWIFFFEFGTLLIYVALNLCLRWRIKSGYYTSAARISHAKQAAQLMLAYPLVYVICTLPLAALRMFQLSHDEREEQLDRWLCFAGAMITSNGWLNVLLYCLTRRIELFSSRPPIMDNGLESFQSPFGRRDPFGNETTCEYIDPEAPSASTTVSLGNMKSVASAQSEFVHLEDERSRFGSSDDVKDMRFLAVTIREQTTVEVTSEPMTEAEKRLAEAAWRPSTPEGFSSRNSEESRADRRREMEAGIDGMEFKTRPEGF